MKKKIIIVVFILVLITISIYYTYAIDVSINNTSGNADLTYNIDINDTSGRNITVKSNSTKTFDIFITNNNGAKIKYQLAYNGEENENITIAQVDTSINSVSDFIDNNTTNQISLIIINNTSSDVTYNIIPVTGYENGGDLIVQNGYTIISDVYSYPIEPNSPDLIDGLIPITYSNDKWVKADSSNTDNSWYNYDNKIWANAVLVTDTNRSTYQSASVGTEIPEDDILAYYVWIPRYKYKVWNITKTVGTDSYDAYHTGIDIVWEKERNTTGTISCNYDFTIADGSLSEICSGTNGEYYTHPAFTFGDTQVRGIWVGKFEISAPIEVTCAPEPESDDIEYYDTCYSTTLSVRIKPNVSIWAYNYISNFSYVIQNMQISENEYGLPTDKTKADSHMIKNMEWGAVAYLTNSNYGRCSDGACLGITKNNNNSYITGGNNYVLNIDKTTTGNIYGIYDMSGGAYEYVMGNESRETGWYQYSDLSNKQFSYSDATAKYIDTYAYGESDTDQSAYNRARLGDATAEIVLLANNTNGGWYESTTCFFNYGSWLVRSGDANVFDFYYSLGAGAESETTRAILLSLQ